MTEREREWDSTTNGDIGNGNCFGRQTTREEDCQIPATIIKWDHNYTFTNIP